MIPAAAASGSMGLRTESTYDRRFYGGMGVLLAALTLVGFGPTFYFRWWFGPTPTVTGASTLTPLTYVHGALFSAWVLLFMVQTTLIAGRRVALHRRLGVAGAVLAAVMFVAGLSTAIAAGRRGAAPPGVDALTFLVVPVFDMILFALFVSAAIVRRRDKEAHKRLMLLAYLAIIPASTARLPGMLPLGPLAFFALGYGLAFLGAGYDYWSRGRVSTIYKWGIPVLLLSVPLRLALSSTGAWQSFARFVTQ
jgi:uncharacterized membrane protein YozB (DUF420 family)